MNDPLVRIQELLGCVTLISYIIFGGDMVIAWNVYIYLFI